MFSEKLKKYATFVKLKKRLGFGFPLNHLFILFRLFGLAAYKRNKDGKFNICHLSKLISFVMPFFLGYCSTKAMVAYFQYFVGFLNLPIAIAFLAWGGGCVASYVTIVLKNANICHILNKMVEMKRILQARNPTYNLNENYLVIVPFYLGLAMIAVNNTLDMIEYLRDYDGNNAFLRLTVFIVHDMYVLMDTYFASVIISFWNLSKCFRFALKIENFTSSHITTYNNPRQYNNSKRKNMIKVLDLLQFYKKNYNGLHDLRQNLNDNFGVVNFINSSYTLVALIYTAYSSAKRYYSDPFNSIRDFIYHVLLYGGKLVAVLNICTKIYEEVCMENSLD